MRAVIDDVFCAPYMVSPGSAVSWNRQDYNRQSMQRVKNTWSSGAGLCLNFRTQSSFPNNHFLDSVRKK